ncbi:hypothetical protein COW36_12815 [bacterium (Candidatus Blackallbacteria) CG17_big_fil_post_rev_8_21_14_2_50_48_46]|uniref:Uncharacterized protein n=1 Tax=bacterium (Candidatus Blackallbacteria) CG17_big_fil_post_rev_8_21_14_2_50_48_46 TaxID=2014261 RepID=A0A2M7G461_9BACT|nr:MAG: hypothetical protein COW64_02450 [bacterium (Candidatus Blackallbacteria) CG18_big_fil_WC_8_21_14_2_50_49_26]PIW16643.1 MAG: hypothetical protein COW36_12815 [bacterium (Candidatus Blackallbacteria) CG17_big_fil_post_rev_8_21_14_2_50_48_46]PIW46150.1 MAG: hypothetical protein COW20_18075 [bacterium (Candidatus Blackallbacteria) CG13_big_fil_rev_8_21_14_2_50_49_14]
MLENPLAELEGEIDEVRVQLFDEELSLHFPYHKSAVASVKAIEGAIYNPSDKSWCLPITPQNTYTVQDAVVSLRKFFRREVALAEQREEMRHEIADSVVEGLRSDFEHARVSFEKQEGCVALSIPYDPKSIRLIKKIEGARWDSSDKVWLLPADQERKIRTALKGIFKLLG